MLKNHIRINGQLLQTNKKWSHLKARQKAWIMETAKCEYDHFVQERGKLPVHGSKQQLNERIYAQIEAKGIWVPYNEVKRILDSRIAHWNRQIQRAEATSEAGESEQTPAEQEALTKEE